MATFKPVVHPDDCARYRQQEGEMIDRWVPGARSTGLFAVYSAAGLLVGVPALIALFTLVPGRGWQPYDAAILLVPVAAGISLVPSLMRRAARAARASGPAVRVIEPEALDTVAEEFPELGAILTTAQEAARRIIFSTASRQKILPIADRDIDRELWDLASRTLDPDTLTQRRTVQKAAAHERLAGLVEQRREDLAALDRQLQERADRLVAIAEDTKILDQLLDEMELADALSSGSALSIRAQLMARGEGEGEGETMEARAMSVHAARELVDKCLRDQAAAGTEPSRAGPAA